MTETDAGASPSGETPEPALPSRSPSPIREVLALPSFRRYWLSQLAVALVGGTLRFTIIWLVLDLTDWTPAVGLVGLALGVPAMVISLPAGALSDRVDRIRLIVAGSLVTAAVLAGLAAIVMVDLVNVGVVTIASILIGSALAVISPALQAIVPSLVPPERLMTGVGLQGMSANIALLVGSVIGGAAIAIAGTAGALGLLGVLSGCAALGMSGVRLPERAPNPNRPKVAAEIWDGLRFASGREPLRSMIAIGVVASGAWGIVQLVLPDVMRSTLGQGAFSTSVLFGALGIGMFATTIGVANRSSIARRGRLLAFLFAGFCGTTIVVMGISRSYLVVFLAMMWWGITGGVVMTLQRTILQEATPDEYMGRVMGFNSFAVHGSYPIAAALVAIAGSFLSGEGTLVALGVVASVAAALAALRPAVLRA